MLYARRLAEHAHVFVHGALLCMRSSSATSCTRYQAACGAQHCTVITTNIHILYHVLAHSYRFNESFFARDGEERKRRAGHVAACVISSLLFSSHTSAADQPLLFASTPTLSPPRRCPLFFCPSTRCLLDRRPRQARSHVNCTGPHSSSSTRPPRSGSPSSPPVGCTKPSYMLRPPKQRIFKRGRRSS
jgi:hypothetical protein